MTALDRCREIVRALWEPEFDGSLSEWAEGLELPQSTRAPTFKADEAPWLKRPMDALLDHSVRQVTLISSAGSAKSLAGEIFATNRCKHGNGIFFYVAQDDDAAKDVMEDRFFPMLLANKMLAVMMPLDRSKKRIAKIRFPNATLYALGANKNNARSKRVSVLICDETHLWAPGMLSAFKKRTNAVSDYKILVLSTGSIEGDETCDDFRAGSQEMWHVVCPECKQAQQMENKRLQFERSERTIDPDGGFRMNVVRESVFYECAHCPAHWRDTTETRRWLTETGHYIATNPNAPAEHVSCHIGGLAIHWMPWGDLIERWLNANRAAKGGSVELLKTYVTEDLGEFWDDAPREDNPEAAGKRAGAYKLGERRDRIWEDGWIELTRFLVADRQDGYFWAGCRAYGADGSSRQVWCRGDKTGPWALVTYEELEEWREKLGVEPPRTFVDCKHFTKEVQMRCAQYGWQGFMGSDTKSWPHSENSPAHPRQVARFQGLPFKDISEAPVRLPFSPPQTGHASIGLAGRERRCFYYHWSNPAIKDFWHFRHNGGGASWTHASDAPKWYRDQTGVEHKRKRYNKHKGTSEWFWTHSGKPNHATDFEQMTDVAAMMDHRINLAPSLLSVPEEIEKMSVAVGGES